MVFWIYLKYNVVFYKNNFFDFKEDRNLVIIMKIFVELVSSVEKGLLWFDLVNYVFFMFVGRYFCEVIFLVMIAIIICD